VSALAAGHDLRLNGTRADGTGILFSCTPAPCQPDNRAFRELTTELAYVVAPRSITPAETLGHSGFSVGMGWSGSFVSDEDYWRLTEDGQQTQRPTEFFNVLQVEFRKGLPWSFEVGTHVMWVLDSEMVAPGIDLRWSFQEGYDFLPDFALRAAVNTLLGTRDFDLTTVSVDFSLSKAFAVGGVAQLAPYFSWGVLFISATSDIVDPTPTEFVNDGGVLRPDIENDIVFESVGPTDDFNSRAILGLRALFSVLEVSVQGELQMFSQGNVVGPVGTVGTKLGLVY
jgi:hypothetical protein